MLEHYLSEMGALGVDDQTYESLWDDFRFGCLIRLAAPIALTSRGYPDADALATAILPRVTSAVLATTALGSLGQRFSREQSPRQSYWFSVKTTSTIGLPATSGSTPPT